MSANAQLLLVDDDHALSELLTDYLETAGFTVEAAHDGEDGLRRALSGRHAIAVLDVMLPGLNGFELLRRIRSQSRLPVLMLTARGEEVDRIVGLEIGADDYLAKPFNPRELAARLHAILRRTQSPAPPASPADATLAVDDIELDPGGRLVRRGGRPVELTGAEFALLEVLLRAAGRVVSRDDLSRRVLGRRAQPYDRAIDMHVSHVRKKLGPAEGDRDRIRSIRGTGYIYVTGAANAGHASEASH